MTTKQPVYGGEAHSGRAARPLGQAVGRGICCRCPRCGEGALYRSFVKTVDTCQVCGEAIHHHRADDFPAYLVLFIVGHIMVGGFLVVENSSRFPPGSIWRSGCRSPSRSRSP